MAPSVKMTKKISSRSPNVGVPAKRVKTPADAARFIDSVGLCVLFPLKNVPLPSLYYAVSHRRDARWDKFAQLIWKWKDELPRKRLALYAKALKGRGTFISLELLPHLLAMHETAVSPNKPDGGESFYNSGRIPRDACDLWKALAQHGPMPTLELRHACKLETQAGNKRFKKSMLELQSLLIVTHSGAEQETAAWASNRFDLVCRAFPKQSREAAAITPEAARQALAKKYLSLYPAAPASTVARLFGWTKAQAVTALSM